MWGDALRTWRLLSGRSGVFRPSFRCSCVRDGQHAYGGRHLRTNPNPNLDPSPKPNPNLNPNPNPNLTQPQPLTLSLALSR